MKNLKEIKLEDLKILRSLIKNSNKWLLASEREEVKQDLEEVEKEIDSRK